MRKGLFRPSRRILSLEVLEERTLLSGNVVASLNPMTGVLTIQGDIGNNAIHIFAPVPSPIPGVPLLSVAGDQVLNFTLPPKPPDFTSVNSVAVSNATLSSATSLNVNMLGGNDSIKIGTTPSGTPAGFTLPQNIVITAQGGNDTFAVENVGNNKIVITNPGGNNSVLVKNDTTGEVDTTTGNGNDSVLVTGTSTIGTTKIVTGNGNDTVLVNATPNLALRPQAFGVLSIVSGDPTSSGGVTQTVTGTTAGIVTMVSGNGNANLTLNNTSLIAGSIVTGSAGGTHNISVNGNTVTGSAGLSVAAGPANQQVISVNGDTFTGGGNLNVNAGNGGIYWDLTKPSPFPITGNASIFTSVGSTGIGTANINLGTDFFATAMADSVKNLLLNVGNNWGVIDLNNAVAGDETITVGSQVAPGAPFPTFVDNDTVSGNQTITIGSAQPSGTNAAAGPTSANVIINSGGADKTFTFGDNLNITLGGSATSLTVASGNNNNLVVNTNVNPANNVAVNTTTNPTDNTHTGAITITGGNANNVTINGASLAPQASSMTITLGSGATVLTNGVQTTGDQSVTVGNNPVSVAAVNTNSNNLNITTGTAAPGTGSTFLLVQGAKVNNNLTVNAPGSPSGTLADGNVTLALINTQVLDALFAALGGGVNTAFAQNLSALFGNIDGGGSGSSVYLDLGGNSGFTTSGFSGYF
jgi:hypothetical protein